MNQRGKKVVRAELGENHQRAAHGFRLAQQSDEARDDVRAGLALRDRPELCRPDNDDLGHEDAPFCGAMGSLVQHDDRDPAIMKRLTGRVHRRGARLAPRLVLLAALHVGLRPQGPPRGAKFLQRARNCGGAACCSRGVC